MTHPLDIPADSLATYLEANVAGFLGPLTATKVKGGVWIEPAAAIQAAIAVRAARQEQGRTLAELARALGTSWAAAQKLESPRANPTIKQLERTAASLGKRLVLSME